MQLDLTDAEKEILRQTVSDQIGELRRLIRQCQTGGSHMDTAAKGFDARMEALQAMLAKINALK